ncbi:poly-gamma-glutamate biosynthesis protein PgsC/CapC [Altericroceibacterium xinjiangense]|uniref:poly-gamma-glutamate biosynthesis protein PgsC/CapC n=1 Tax=Altericroceibacterium xinjiangense TaxID=762261 RepID=UPI000F7DA730|nr:poly-gamma-glutamate biosynthesis protein PgsC/CapC [Altericroceibacterium xinjiangense]
MNGFALPILPDGSLASSVITTVWVGVLVVTFFNLRFGWVLSGLVVPGYLVPLLISKPVSGVVVIIEGAITYGLFWLLSERFSGPTRWSSFFGRDRFMGLILVSVAVRLLLDGWLLPLAAKAIDSRYGLDFDWGNNLHSFGLIVVALLANQLWKPGFARGMTQALVTIGATFLIVRFGLMEFTNFRIGSVAYLYENFASSILASPKAYIILITTALIASRLNLRYGWDFSGILIPALLALQWYQPWKILTSVAEALIIFGLGSALLSSRMFAGSTVEGARKILLFFNISFAYRLVLGHALGWAGVEDRINDYYGFGYLLPTLIALKAHDKGILTRVMRLTVQTSFLGAVLGSAIGFALALALPRTDVAIAQPGGSGSVAVPGRIAAAAIGAARRERGDAGRIPLSAIDDFRSGIALVDAGRAAEADPLLGEAGYRVGPVAGGRLAVTPLAGRGAAFLFDPSAPGSLCLQLRDPVSLPGLGTAAVRLADLQQARWLAIGGDLASGRNVARAPARLFGQAVPDCLQIAGAQGSGAALELVGDMGTRLDLARLQSAFPRFRLRFAAPSAAASSRLLLTHDAVRHLLVRAPAGNRVAESRPLTADELAFFDFEVLGPLLRTGAGAVPAVNPAAAALGFAVTAQAEGEARQRVAIDRRGKAEERYLLRPGASGPVLQVPADPELMERALTLLRQLDARALIVVSNEDRLDERSNRVPDLVTQALLRQPAGERFILQVRARPTREGGGAAEGADATGLVLAADRMEPVGGFGQRLAQRLRRLGLDVRLLDWGAATAGLEIGPAPQLRYARQALDARVAILWVPVSSGDGA